jgi:hypothetical protein
MLFPECINKLGFSQGCPLVITIFNDDDDVDDDDNDDGGGGVLVDVDDDADFHDEAL